MFSPWKFNVDTAAAALLERHGWSTPDGDDYPTGHDLVDATGAAGRHKPSSRRTSVNTRVIGGRAAGPRSDEGRAAATRHRSWCAWTDPDGEQDVLARAVIDASGTIETPGRARRLGPAGPGRTRPPPTTSSTASLTCWAPIAARYAGPSGAGRGERPLGLQRAARSRARLADEDPSTRHRRGPFGGQSLGQLLGGARNDQLEERGKLGTRVRGAPGRGRLELVTGFRVDRVDDDGRRRRGRAPATRRCRPSTRSSPRPASGRTGRSSRELRLDLDPAVESPRALAPLIDPEHPQLRHGAARTAPRS